MKTEGESQFKISKWNDLNAEKVLRNGLNESKN